MAALLKVEDINVYYGSIHAVKGVSFEVNEGEIVTLIGANGAGKSTVLNTVSGLLHPKSGTVSFMGQDMKGVAPHKVVERGLAQVPEGRRVFLQMTVEDNLRFFAGLAKCAVPKELPFRLDDKRKERVGRLSGGQKRQVSIACALLGEPKVLLLDEPAAGLDVEYRESLLQLLQEKKAAGCTILYVGHEPLEVAEICDKLLFLGDEVKMITKEELAGTPEDKMVFCENYMELMKTKKMLRV